MKYLKLSFFIIYIIIFHSCTYQYSDISETKLDKTKVDSDRDTHVDKNSIGAPDNFVESHNNSVESPENSTELKNYNLGRKVIKIPNLGTLMEKNVTGKITVEMCVNPLGDVIHAEIIPDETTITNRYKLKEALRITKNYKYEKEMNAPKEQCGKLVFKLDMEH